MQRAAAALKFNSNFYAFKHSAGALLRRDKQSVIREAAYEIRLRIVKLGRIREGASIKHFKYEFCGRSQRDEPTWKD